MYLLSNIDKRLWVDCVETNNNDKDIGEVDTRLNVARCAAGSAAERPPGGAATGGVEQMRRPRQFATRHDRHLPPYLYNVNILH